MKGAHITRTLSAESFKFFSIDVANEQAVSDFFLTSEIQNFHLSCLVTCAGILDLCDIAEIGFDSWNKVVDTNLTGTFLFFRNAIRKIKNDGNQATLYAIGSRWGNEGHTKASAYSASKAALRAFVKSVQYDLIGSRIRAMLISPGSVAGTMSTSVDAKNDAVYIDPNQIGALIAFINKTDANVLFDEISIKAYPYDYQA